MKRFTKQRIILAALALVSVLGTTWLVAEGDSAGAASQSGEAGKTPLPDFLPREKLPADSAVAFPTDI
jgi:hypothetical protein